MSFVEWLLHTLMNCGTNAVVVGIAATYPIVSVNPSPIENKETRVGSQLRILNFSQLKILFAQESLRFPIILITNIRRLFPYVSARVPPETLTFLSCLAIFGYRGCTEA